MSEHCLLILRANGSAELLSLSGRQLWESDSDDDFKDEISEEFLTEADVADILDYLVEAGTLSDKEADACEIEEESLDGDDQDDNDADELGDDDAELDQVDEST